MPSKPKSAVAPKPASRGAARPLGHRAVKPAVKTSIAKAPAKTAVKLDSPTRVAKLDQIVALLSRDTGASLGQLTEATGWQPHSVRGAISGTLRKRRGLVVVCSSSVYRIVAPA